MMGRALLIVGGFAVAVFLASGVLGYGEHADVESLRLHLLTGFVAVLLDLFGRVSAEDALKDTKERLHARLVKEQVHGE